MPPVACAACKQKMSSEAAVCPHCGARASGAPASLADVKLSPEELRALVAADPSSRSSDDEPAGPLQWALVPHRRTTGAARVAEVALTVACLPLFVGGVLPLVVVRRLARGRARELSGEAAAVLALAVPGGLTLAGTLLELGMSIGASAAFVLGEIALLAIRGGLRAGASTSRELMRLARDE